MHMWSSVLSGTFTYLHHSNPNPIVGPPLHPQSAESARVVPLKFTGELHCLYITLRYFNTAMEYMAISRTIYSNLPINNCYFRYLPNMFRCFPRFSSSFWHVFQDVLPSGYVKIAIENNHWIYPLKMVFFHSYVSLPEGNHHISHEIRMKSH